MENLINHIEKVLSKDMDSKSLSKALEKSKEIIQEAISIFHLKDYKEWSLEERVLVLTFLGLGRDRTINVMSMSNFKINRDHIKTAKEFIENQEQTELRLQNEKMITKFKTDSTKRSKRMKLFEDAGVDWSKVANEYVNGGKISILSAQLGINNVHAITEQLKDDELYDESRSTLLKNKKALELQDSIDDNFITQLVKDNPLDDKESLWRKAKIEYPWLLRKQMFEKLVDLGLERTKEEVNKMRSVKNKISAKNAIKILTKDGHKVEFSKEEIELREKILDIIKENPSISNSEIKRTLKKMLPNMLKREISRIVDLLDLGSKENYSNLVKLNTVNKVNKVFGSVDNLVQLYMDGKLGSYNKTANFINEKCPEGLEVSTRQVEKIITKDPNYQTKKSYPQKQLFEYVKNTFPEYEILEEYLIPGTNKRIDVFIKDLKVGLEFNGDYWHSDEVVFYNYKVSSEEFHKTRADEAKSQGIKLCFIWEEDWNENYEQLEKLMKDRNWDSEILNKYSNEKSFTREVVTPKRENSNSNKKTHKQLVQEQIKKLLEDAGLENDFTIEGNEMKIKF